MPKSCLAAVVLVVHAAYLKYLPAAVASIDAQSLPFAHKVLVFDTAFESEVPTLKMPGDWSIVFGNFRNPNLARNEGLANVGKVEWVCFWDADNLMPDTYFQSMMRTLLESDERVGVCYPDVQQIEAEGFFGHYHKMPEWSLAAAQNANVADTGSLWKLAALREVGGFKAGQFGHDDYALALEIFRAGWHGKRSGVLMNHFRHGSGREKKMGMTQSLWTAYSFAFVTLWSGDKATAERILCWLATAEVPPNSTLYWVDDSGGQMRQMLLQVYGCLLADKFRKMVYIDAGRQSPRDGSGEYLHFERHQHVAHLYNMVLPGLREEIVVTLEDDTLPPMHGCRALLENFVPGSKVVMAAGVYRSRHNPAHICASRNLEVWKDVPKFDDLPDAPFRVGMTGGGFAMIQNHALQKCLPMRCEYSASRALMGWDGNLGLSFTSLGFVMVADPRVKCAHLCSEVVAYECGERRVCRPYDYGYGS